MARIEAGSPADTVAKRMLKDVRIHNTGMSAIAQISVYSRKEQTEAEVASLGI